MSDEPSRANAVIRLSAACILSITRAFSSCVGNRRERVEEDDSYVPYAAPVNTTDPDSPYVRQTFRPVNALRHMDPDPLVQIEFCNSMAELFSSSCERHGKKPCMGFRPRIDSVICERTGKVKGIKQGRYKWLTYTQVNDIVDSYSKGILSLGIKPGQNVVLLSETSLDWMCIAQALMRNNIPIVTLYATLSEEGILHGIKETKASMVICSPDILKKMRNNFADLDQITNVIYMSNNYGGRDFPMQGKVVTGLSELALLGKKHRDLRAEGPRRTDTAIIMYTSGSTGVPKGVVLTHGNMLTAARALGEIFASINVTDADSYIGYLPLAHVFELNCEVLATVFGVKIGYSSSQTLTDSSPMVVEGQQGDCSQLQPTILAAVPLVLDRVKKAILEKAKSKSILAYCILSGALKHYNKEYLKGRDTTIFDSLIFNKIRSAVGGKVRLVATGSAPLSQETHSFIRYALGAKVLQGYGLTETCAAATCMDVTDRATGEVGAPVFGAHIKLVSWPEGNYFAKDGRGEIIIGGEMVAKGYYNRPELTNESFFKEDGVRWFRSGDIGEVTPNGTYKIIDRKKDLVKLQHGEYVALGKIETELKTLNIVDNICVYGDGLSRFLVCLMTPNSRQLSILGNQLNTASKTHEELCADEDITRNILESMQTHLQNRRFLRVEIPQKLKLCAEEWTPDNGLVTAAFKLIRPAVVQKYNAQLQLLNNNNTQN